MKKVFISQPMNGKTKAEILVERDKAIKLCKKYLGEDIKVLDTLFEEEAPKEVNQGLWFLGKSIQMLSHADYAFFCEGWEETRGCVIEHDCAKKYNIHIV